MSIIYRDVKDPNLVCDVCYDQVANKAHRSRAAATDDVLLHPICEKCLKQWVRIKETCPICRFSIDTSSIFSLKERMFQKTQTVLKAVAAVALLTTVLTVGAWLDRVNYYRLDNLAWDLRI